jgi:hypothetical protein
LRAESGVYRAKATFSAEGDAEIAIRADDAYILLVDGKPLFTRPLGRVGFPLVSRVGVHFVRGEHEIELIALAHSSSDRLEVQVLSPRGLPVAKEVSTTTRLAGVVFGLLPETLWMPENSDVATNGFGKVIVGTFSFSSSKDSVDCQGPPVALRPIEPGLDPDLSALVAREQHVAAVG